MMPHTILVADDDPDIRVILQTLLSSAGHSVILANDGNQVAEQLRAGLLPDLALLDINMPGLNGNEVCACIRALPEHGQHVGIIMLTASDGLEDKVRSLDGGADDYITKPFHHQELLARVRAALRIRDLSMELHRARAQLIERERQTAVTELAGSTAHALNQPLAAIKLNLHLLEILPHDDARSVIARIALKEDVDRLSALIMRMRSAAKAERSDYHDGKKVIDL